MKKRVLGILLAICLLVSALPLYASAEIVNGELQELDLGAAGHLTYYVREDRDGKYIEIARPDGQSSMDVMGEVVVPSEIETEQDGTLPVKAIAPLAFAMCRSVKSITLPEGLQTIGDAAFMLCDQLETMEIPSSVTSIGSAFRDSTCKVTVAEGNAKYASLAGGFLCEKTEGGLTLLHCPKREGNLALPEGITALGEESLPQTYFDSVTFPSTLKNIPVFGKKPDGSDGLLRFVTAGTWTVTTATEEKEAAAYCSINGALYTKDKSVLIKYPTSVVSFQIDPAVTAFGPGAFSGGSFSEANLSGSKITKLPFGTFHYCKLLTKVSLPNDITEIGPSVFQGCSSLSFLELPASLTKLGSDTFSECDQLTELQIPAGLIEGLEAAFSLAPQLVVTVAKENTKYFSEDGALYERSGEGLDGGKPVLLLHVADGKKTVAVPEGVTAIADYAFYQCKSISNVILPSTLQTIGAMAFQGCSGLLDITIPASVTEIGDRAFHKFGRNDGAVCQVTVEKDNQHYYSYEGGLYRTADKTLLYMPNQAIAEVSPGTRKIGNNAFWSNDKLQTVKLPDSLEEIGEEAFYACKNLRSITLPKGLTRISQRAFAGELYAPCGLTEITIPNSVTYLGTRVFENCDALVKVSASEAEPQARMLHATTPTAGGPTADPAHKLDSATFANCPQLTTVEVSAGITEIGANVFENCPKLKHIVIPNGVTAIDDEAFAGLGGFTIYGEEGSAAQAFARDHDIAFKTGEPAEEPSTPSGPSGGSEEPEEPEEPGKELPFADIKGHWAFDAIQWVYENNVFQGVSGTRFAPQDSMERGMLALVLYRLAGEPEVQGDSPFTDVPAGKYYTEAVIWASQQGIVTGVGEDRFAPLEPVSRQQIATMLYRYEQKFGTADEAGDLSGFADADRVATWAQDAMAWAVGAQVLQGDNGKLRPQDRATRAEVAAMVQRRFAESGEK